MPRSGFVSGQAKTRPKPRRNVNSECARIAACCGAGATRAKPTSASARFTPSVSRRNRCTDADASRSRTRRQLASATLARADAKPDPIVPSARYSGERAQSPTPVAAIGSPREGEVGEPEQHQQLKRRQETPLRSLPRAVVRRADRGDHKHERQCRARQTSPEERGHGQRRQRGKHRVQRQLGARVPLTVEISESDCQQPGPHRAVLVVGPPEPRPDRAHPTSAGGARRRPRRSTGRETAGRCRNDPRPSNAHRQ